MSSILGEHIRVSVFGESHGPAIGVVIDGLPSGMVLDMAAVRQFMARRAPGRNRHSTARQEADMPEILSGLNARGAVTTGSPLCAIIRNADQHSNDYASLAHTPRPGHADYAAELRYCGAQERAGGGHFSGRLTAPLAFAGAVCLHILAMHGVTIGAHLSSVADVEDAPFDPVNISSSELNTLAAKEFPVIDNRRGEAMRAAIEAARQAHDSVGGVIECAVIGYPGGVGGPMFDGVENALARGLFGIPAVKGVEFGAGFAAARLRGSQNNDPFVLKDGKVATATNNHGGILGGITTGMPILFRVAVKPTPSISQPQRTVDLISLTENEIQISGRHDPCIAPRAVPVVEAVAAIVLLDMLVGQKGEEALR